MPGKPPSCILLSVLQLSLGLAKALPFPLGTFPTSASSPRTCLATPPRSRSKGGWACTARGLEWKRPVSQGFCVVIEVVGGYSTISWKLIALHGCMSL